MYEILASVDGDEDRARSQAEAITELPLDLDDVRVTIAHCFSHNTEGASITQLRSVREVQEIFEEHGVDFTLEEVSSDDPAARILDLADELDTDMLVMAGRKRTPVKKALFGSVSQDIVLHTDRPVLVCGEIEEKQS